MERRRDNFYDFLFFPLCQCVGNYAGGGCGGGEHVNKADARRGADHASMQGWLGTTYNSQGEFADAGEGRGHRGGQETKWRVVAMREGDDQVVSMHTFISIFNIILVTSRCFLGRKS